MTASNFPHSPRLLTYTLAAGYWGNISGAVNLMIELYSLELCYPWGSDLKPFLPVPSRASPLWPEPLPLGSWPHSSIPQD